jgi:hypothetical protein
MEYNNRYLVIGGICSIVVAILHVAIIIGGADWYRFFGAGEEMALMSESGSPFPVLITSVIVIVFIIWGVYAFSGAGIIRTIPLLRLALIVISSIYLIRGLGGIFLVIFSKYVSISVLVLEYNDSELFMLISSIICTVFGMFYSVGTVKSWSNLANKIT